MVQRLLVFALVVFGMSLPLHAKDAPFDLEAGVGRFAAATDAAERFAAALRLSRDDGVEAQALGDALAKAWVWSDEAEKSEDITWERTSSDGTTHTVFAYVPEAYTPKKAWPLMVWLHGGISRDQDGGGEGGVRMFADEAEKKGFLILSPSTQNGAHWWTPAGAAYLRGALLDAKQRWHIDPERVVVMGFSDGGSGAFHLLAHDPSPYCALVPMMGNPLVSRIYGGPTWDANMSSRPVYAVNGGKDGLYPSARMKPLMDAIIEAGADMTWIDEPESGHEPSFLERRWDEIHTFWMEHPRDALPASVTWASSAPKADGRFAWVEILALDPAAPKAEGLGLPEELALPPSKPRPRLGIRLDVEADGPGLVIQGVEDGTPAAEAGMEDGDRIVRLGDDALEGVDVREKVTQLRAFLDALTEAEEDGLFVVQRGDEERQIRTRPQVLASDKRELKRPASLGYDVSPGLVEAKVEGNTIQLGTVGVKALRLHLAEPLVDLDQELVVVVNGKERFRGKVKRDKAYLLAQAAEQGPGGPRYEAYLDLQLE